MKTQTKYLLICVLAGTIFYMPTLHCVSNNLSVTPKKSTIHKKTLSKGGAQALIGIGGLGNVALTYWLQYKSVRLKQAGYNSQQTCEYLSNIIRNNYYLWPFLAVGLTIEIVAMIATKNDLKLPPQDTSWWELTPFIPFGFPGLACLSITFVSGKMLVRGIHNIKISLDPKK